MTKSYSRWLHKEADETFDVTWSFKTLFSRKSQILWNHQHNWRSFSAVLHLMIGHQVAPYVNYSIGMIRSDPSGDTLLQSNMAALCVKISKICTLAHLLATQTRFYVVKSIVLQLLSVDVSWCRVFIARHYIITALANSATVAAFPNCVQLGRFSVSTLNLHKWNARVSELWLRGLFLMTRPTGILEFHCHR